MATPPSVRSSMAEAEALLKRGAPRPQQSHFSVSRVGQQKASGATAFAAPSSRAAPAPVATACSAAMQPSKAVRPKVPPLPLAQLSAQQASGRVSTRSGITGTKQHGVRNTFGLIGSIAIAHFRTHLSSRGAENWSEPLNFAIRICYS